MARVRGDDTARLDPRRRHLARRRGGRRLDAGGCHRRLGEEWDAELVARGARIFSTQLAANVTPVDRLAEDGRLPEREGLEPAERLDVAAGLCDIAADELRSRRESGLGGDR